MSIRQLAERLESHPRPSGESPTCGAKKLDTNSDFEDEMVRSPSPVARKIRNAEKTFLLAGERRRGGFIRRGFPENSFGFPSKFGDSFHVNV